MSKFNKGDVIVRIKPINNIMHVRCILGVYTSSRYLPEKDPPGYWISRRIPYNSAQLELGEGYFLAQDYIEKQYELAPRQVLL